MDIFYQNVNRIKTKIHEFYLNCSNADYDVICLTETNLNCSIFDNELFDNRYSVFRRDRDKNTSHKDSGGGVLVAVKTEYNVVMRSAWASRVEDIWVSILPQRSSRPTLNLCVCYLPPDIQSTSLENFYNNVQRIILGGEPNNVYLIVGDFNTPSIVWSRSSSQNNMVPSPVVDRKSSLLLDTLSLCGLLQYNHIPNQNSRQLDLVLSTPEVTVCVTPAEPLSKIDRHHPALVFTVGSSDKGYEIRPPHDSKRLQFKKCNFDSVKAELRNVDWLNILSDKDVDLATSNFYDITFKIIHKHTPTVSQRQKRFPFWFTPALIKCLKEKNKLHNKFKKYKNPRDYDEYRLLRTRCKTLLKSCRDSFLASTEEGLKKDTKPFWRYIKSKRGKGSGMPQTMKRGNECVSDNISVCEMFSQYFGSVYEKHDAGIDSDINEYTVYGCNNLLSHILGSERGASQAEATESKQGRGS
ncbi:hypothetical protein ABMA28_010775 [Loxostege sticticalis]|uniref:Endonuclease/exonuclease/phosphatase domain-containing protein n=1 Tax=Loxostege sticticalis TaxID=481309 RepID=A0ABD0S9E9_LOXSC